MIRLLFFVVIASPFHLTFILVLHEIGARKMKTSKLLFLTILVTTMMAIKSNFEGSNLAYLLIICRIVFIYIDYTLKLPVFLINLLNS